MVIEFSKIQKRSVTKKKEDYSNRFLPFLSFGPSGKGILNDTKKEEFYTEIFLLLQSGLDLKQSIEIFTGQQSKDNVHDMFKGIEERLVRGDSLSDAFSHYADFSIYEYYCIKIGEEGGRLLEVLDELSHFYQRKIKQQKQLVNALVYPMVILVTAVIAVGFMMNFIVPLFADAFKRFDSDLPALTQFIVVVSNNLRDRWWVMLSAVIVLVLSLRLLSKIPKIRNWIGQKIPNIPILGRLLHKIYMARFCQSMSLMVSARTPLITSLELVGKMIEYAPLQSALIQVNTEIHRGKLLYQSMAQYEIFEPRMISLIKVGEETNKLDVIFSKLYEQYSSEAEQQTSIMNSLLEPILIVLVGGLVAIILIAMYLPMFKIGSSIMQ